MPNTKPLRTLVVLTLLAAVVITVHLLPGMDNSSLQQDVRNALHVVGFAIVAAVICQLLCADLSRYVAASPIDAAVIAFVLTAAIAGLAELSQVMAGKTLILRIWPGILAALFFIWLADHCGSGATIRIAPLQREIACAAFQELP